MVMKKLIAISVVFALVVGTAFAVDVGGNVIGTVNVLEGSSVKDSKVQSSATMNRIRFEGSGENEDGTFGGWARFQPDWGSGGPDWGNPPQVWGLAWWKPIEQVKFTIGGNPDGFYGKEGVTGWMFYQMISDTGVVNPNSVWYSAGSHYSDSGIPDPSDPSIKVGEFDFGLQYRNAFYGGFGSPAAHLTISPAEIVDINIAIPFWNGGETGDVFASTHAQLDLKLDFGNIAITYAGATMKGYDQPTLFAYFGLGAIENLGLDIGLGFTFPNEDETSNPIAAGLGVKYAFSDTFGIKFRTVLSFGGEETDPFQVMADLLPYFAVSDKLKVFLSAGLGMTSPDEGDSIVGFHINPYIEVGNEWGPTFYAGFQLSSSGVKNPLNEDNAIVKWAVPVAIGISF